MARLRSLMLLLGVTVLPACSPYVYNQEITGFSSGVDAVVASYQTGQQTVETILEQRQQAAFVPARSRLILLPGCSQADPSGDPPKLPDCAVVAFGTTAAPSSAAVMKNLADAAPAFNALKAYAASLAAVSAAADDTALNQATQGLTSAASGLAGAVAKVAPGASPASSLVTPAGNVIGQGITIYLDQRRYEALRNTVPSVDPAVKTLAQTVQAALVVIRGEQINQLGSDLRASAEPLEVTTVSTLTPSDYQSKLTALEFKVASFNQARGADPTATVAAMVKAHEQLAQALQDNAGQGMAVLTSVENFTALAGQLKTAVDAVSAETTTASAPAAAKPPATAKK